jgi:transposase
METTLLIPSVFEVLHTSVSKENIKLDLLFCSTVGYCPLCHTASNRVHSYYQRKVRDLPINGKKVELQICCRKFFCQQEGCPRKIFAQQCKRCLKPYARRLERATEQALSIGLSMGGRPGARICSLTGLSLSTSTILRVLKRTPVPEIKTPTVLGVDDFAFRRGNTYGTILIDLEKRKPVDLLSDREGKTLENWLLAHPGVAVVSRDRSSVYAKAIRNACPEAIQVADRWHLLKNLGENTAKYLETQRSLIQETVREIFNPAEAASSSEEPSNGQTNAAEQQPTEKRYPKFQQTKELQSQGYSARAIARHLRMSRNTIIRYFKQEIFVPKSHVRRTNILDYEPYLRQRWQEGEQCVKSLFKEIKAKGYNDSYTILTVFLVGYPKTSGSLKLPPAKKGMSFPVPA